MSPKSSMLSRLPSANANRVFSVVLASTGPTIEW